MNNFILNMNTFFSINSLWLDWFHNFNCFLLLVVLSFVFYSYFFILFSSFFFKLNLSFKELEFYGCLIPVFILLIQVFPSLVMLFNFSLMSMENDLSVKVTGHQWYWTYEFGDLIGLEFDSYMLYDEFLKVGDYRLLEVDNRLILPEGFFIRFILVSTDVIHSWSIPSFFIKLDLMSGMMSVLNYKFESIGIFYGQCSEICGANHSFMPIVLEITLFKFFLVWLMNL